MMRQIPLKKITSKYKYKYMEHYYNKFVKTLRDFLKDLNRYAPNDGCSEFLKNFDQLDMHKVILRYIGMMKEYEQQLKNMDETIFSNQLIVLPGINLSDIWVHVPTEKKKKVFIYLHTLLVISDMMIQSDNDTPNSNIMSDMPNSNIVSDTTNSNDVSVTPSEFNPYVGVGNTDNNTLSVNEMYSGKLPDEAPTQSSMPGLGSMAGMVGLDKMLNLGKLTDQLKNMTKEDIDGKTNSIKSLLKDLGNDDDNITDFFADMLTTLQSDLKNDKNIDGGNPMDIISNIANSVESKMKSPTENNIDVSKLMQTFQNLATKCTDENGKNMFGNGINPFDMINKMMSGQANDQETENMLNNLPLPSGMTREQCQNMFKQ